MGHDGLGQLYTPKRMGGLSFRDLKRFNLALLGRQVLRLINLRNTLCFHVLSKMYFSNRDVLYSEIIDKLPFAWSSMLEAMRAFDGGLV